MLFVTDQMPSEGMLKAADSLHLAYAIKAAGAQPLAMERG